MKHAVSALLALVLTACSSSGPSAQGFTATVTPTALPTPISNTNQAPIAMTGFGATDADWNATHVADPRFPVGHLYNLSAVTPGNDEYFAVSHDGGRVTGYNLELPVNTSLATAEQRAKAEMPSDAIVVWAAKRDTRAQMELQSATLGPLLRPLGDPAGQVYVELYTVDLTTGDTSLDARNINEGLFGLGSYPRARDAPAC